MITIAEMLRSKGLDPALLYPPPSEWPLSVTVFRRPRPRPTSIPID